VIPLFRGQDVEAAVSPERAVEAVRDAFIAHARGEWSMPPKVYVTNYPAGDFRAMPALGAGHALLKWITSFPGNPARGLPTVAGIVLVSDAATGELQAVLDAASVTALRTGAAAVLAAETLGRSDAETAAVIGAGVNGRATAHEGREVLAVPGEITSLLSKGTNHLLRLGAVPVTCLGDDDDGRIAEPRDDAVAGREPPRRRLHSRRVLRQDQPPLGNRCGKRTVRAWVVAIDAAAEDGDGFATSIEGAAMCPAVDPAREAGYDHDAGPRDLSCQLPRDVRAVVRATSCADDSDGRAREERRVGRAAEEQTRRRVVDCTEARRKVGSGSRDPADAAGREELHVRLRVERRREACESLRAGLAVGRVFVVCGGERRERELVHACCSSVGDR
jgi:hypothetical protein